MARVVIRVPMQNTHVLGDLEIRGYIRFLAKDFTAFTA